MGRFYASLIVVLTVWMLCWAGARPAEAVQVGDKAPDFSLPSTTGKPIALNAFRGKSVVLLEFYHADFGPT